MLFKLLLFVAYFKHYIQNKNYCLYYIKIIFQNNLNHKINFIILCASRYKTLN